MSLSSSAVKFVEALGRVDHGPAVDVVVAELSCSLQVPVKTTGLTNLGEAVLRVAQFPFASTPKQPLALLSTVSCSFPAGTATLIIGNSGSGKTTLLNFVAGRLPKGPAGSSVSGQVLWNGAPPSACGAAVEKVAALAPQVDVHEPLLTVQETLDFAVGCCASPLLPLRSELANLVIDTLGLRECADVKLGNEQVRGVSGGQMKRVTLGEALCCGARVLCLDEITNGLDSAVAAEICAFLAAWAKATGGTVVCALQAPTPEVLAAFHSVLLLSDGCVLHQGAPADLRTALAAKGYATPSYMDTADYALSLCVSPAYTLEEYSKEAGGALPEAALRSREGLAAAWRGEAAKQGWFGGRGVGRGVGGKPGIALDSAFALAQFASPQVHSSATHTALLLGRQRKVVLRNPAISFGRVIQFIILASLFGSVYYMLELDAFVQKISLAIFALSAVSFAAFAEVPAIFVGKRTAARQMAAGFFSPSAYVLSVAVNSLPVSLLSSFVFATIMYWMTGFADDVGRYFFFVFVLVCHELATASLFRFYAFISPTEELAAACAGISTGSLLVFGGFYIAAPLIPNYFLSIFYLSPFSWSVRSMVSSEFSAGGYGVPINTFPGAPQKSDVYMDAFGFFKGMAWKWAGPAYCVGFALVFGLLFSTLAVKYVRFNEAPGAQRLSEEEFRSAASASAAALARTPSGGSLQAIVAPSEGPQPDEAAPPPWLCPTSHPCTSQLRAPLLPRNAVLPQRVLHHKAPQRRPQAPAGLHFWRVSPGHTHCPHGRQRRGEDDAAGFACLPQDRGHHGGRNLPECHPRQPRCLCSPGGVCRAE